MEVPGRDELLRRVRSLPAAQPLIERLEDPTGVYLVGGAVRDLLMGDAPVDLDLAVNGDAAAVARQLGPDVRVYDRFGTVAVKLNGFTYDLARTRQEAYPHPGALPEVMPATLEQDLRRRDFTVNAIALALDSGELTSAPGAIDDLSARRLRVLHDNSFIDDPTRLFRMARYASRLGFEIEPHTHELARNAIESRALDTVTGPRIGAELRLLGQEPDPVRAFEELRVLNLDEAIEAGFGLKDPDLARRALTLLPPEVRKDRLVIATATHDTDARELLDRLAFEAPDRDAIVAAATGADSLAARLENATRPSAIADAIQNAPLEQVALAGAVGPETQAREWLTTLRHIRPDIDGSDLLAAGVPEGPAIGRGLKAALAAKLDGSADAREAQLEHALQAAGTPR
jgi:tRNA nucleotidyltransferase (CCA-adding enzyme)